MYANYLYALLAALKPIRSSPHLLNRLNTKYGKPGRDGSESWVIHASADRSREILELDRDEAADLLLSDFFAQSQLAPQRPSYITAHRWRYAFPVVEKAPSSILSLVV